MSSAENKESVVSRSDDWDRSTLVLYVVITLLMIGGWAIFLTGLLKGVFFTTSSYDLVGDIIVLMLAFWGLIHYIKKGLPVLFIFYLLGFCLSLIVLAFSSFYWAHRHGFSHPLTHLDAAYVALGTLSGGTGNILATQEGTRAIQMTQEFVDLVFLLVVVGVALVPIATIVSSKKAPTPPAGGEKAVGPGTTQSAGNGGHSPTA